MTFCFKKQLYSILVNYYYCLKFGNLALKKMLHWLIAYKVCSQRILSYVQNHKILGFTICSIKFGLFCSAAILGSRSAALYSILSILCLLGNLDSPSMD